MTRHHYIPVNILSTFTSKEAYQVVSVSPEIKKRIASTDAKVISGGQTRNWPLVVYEKDKQKLTRKLIGQTCSETGLYGVVDPNDRFTRALIRFNLEFDDKSRSFKLNSFDEFMRLGDTPLDPDLIESFYVGAIDREFASLLPAIRTHRPLSDEQIHVILRFIAFARFRTPTWQRVYFPELSGRSFSNYKNVIMGLASRTKSKLYGKWGINLETLSNVIDEHFYHMAVTEYSSRETNALIHNVETKIVIAYTKGEASFVTCDNPCRPYRPDRIRRMFNEPLPGFKDPKTQMLYPVSPSSCIVISTNSNFPKYEYQKVNEKRVRAINTALAIMADREIVFSGPNISFFENWLTLNKLRPIKRP